MGLMHPIFDVRDDTRLKQNYPTGFVVDNNDPLKQGRVRIRVQGLHPPSIPNDKLPWMLPHQSHYPNAGQGVGHVHVPPVGSKLHVMYDGDDPHNAFYKHSPPTLDVHKDNPLRNHPDYPHVYGHKDAGNNLWYCNTKQGKAEAGVVFKDGSSVVFKDGTLSVSMAKDINHSAKGKHTTRAGSGGLVMHSDGGPVTMKGKSINHNGSDTTQQPDTPTDQGNVDTSTATYDGSGNVTEAGSASSTGGSGTAVA